jgi:hypothetical protein
LSDTIQFKPVERIESGMGFGSDGRIEPIIQATVYDEPETIQASDDRGDVLLHILDELLKIPDIDNRGRVIELMAFSIRSRLPAAAQTQAQLAMRLGITPGRCSQLVKKCELNSKKTTYNGLLAKFQKAA